MSDKLQLIDFEIMSPFGNLNRTAGPFKVDEAKDFIEKLKQTHKHLLIRTESRILQKKIDE